ncbi:MAG: methyltransferase [Litoreibacter sp.]
MFSKNQLSEDEFLGGRIKVLQPLDGYRAATDPVFLAAACPAKPGEHILELGCGVGVASLCLNARVNVALTGVERLPEYADLAQRNAAKNEVNFNVVDADLTDMPLSLRSLSFDHVILNPPYFRDGKKAGDAGRAGGRQEETPLTEWVAQALKRLRPKGSLTIIHLTERLSDIIGALSSKAGAIEIMPLAAREGRLAKRVIIRARKGAKGGTTLHNPLILHTGFSHEQDGDSFSSLAKGILRDGQPIVF